MNNIAAVLSAVTTTTLVVDSVRPVAYGLIAVLALFVTVCTSTIVILSRRHPQAAIGLSVVHHTATAPIFLALYVIGFAAVYWLSR